MTADEEVLCYNKGCGKGFNPQENAEDECVFHCGAPVFHDAYKSWSCCEKKTTDFTEFLNIKGCCKGKHNNVKPEEPAKEDKEITPPPEAPKPPERMERPSEEEPLIPLPSSVSASLRKLLDKLAVSDKIDEVVTKESICQRKGCGKAKVDVSDEEDYEGTCEHHPGCPIFHEGMKYWSCCNKKTTDFNDFLKQKGCTKGTHLWGDSSQKKAVQCRYDWHQTGDTVNFTVYAKKVKPELCTVNCNAVKLQMEIHFGDDQVFTFDKVLAGIIEPEKSKITYSATKVEVKMRKAEFFAWPSTFVL